MWPILGGFKSSWTKGQVDVVYNLRLSDSCKQSLYYYIPRVRTKPRMVDLDSYLVQENPLYTWQVSGFMGDQSKRVNVSGNL